MLKMAALNQRCLLAPVLLAGAAISPTYAFAQAEGHR